MMWCLARTPAIKTGGKNPEEMSAGGKLDIKGDDDAYQQHDVEEPGPMSEIPASSSSSSSSSNVSDISVPSVDDHSKLMSLEDNGEKEGSSEEMDQTNEVSVGVSAVAAVRVEVDELAEMVSALQAVVHGGTAIAERDAVYVTEILMRKLLQLDGIEAKGEGRIQRKLEVLRVQGFLEAMDDLKASNSALVGAAQSQ